MSSEIAKLINAEIAGYRSKIAALEAALNALDGGTPSKKVKAPKAPKVDGRKGRVWTEEQKAEASAKRKATMAAKAA